MFRPTKPLFKRTPLRLRGFRRPAIRVLRQELAQLRRPPPPGAIDRPSAPLALDRPFAALLSRPKRSPPPLDIDSTTRWTHSAYAFHAPRLQTLPVSTQASLTALTAHLNALPPRARTLLSPPWSDPLVSRALFRAFVSDCARATALRQDVIGKLKRGRRGGFWHVLRAAMVREPAVAVRHYVGGGVEVRAFVHDVRIGVLREQAARLRKEILGRLKARRHKEKVPRL